MSTADLVGWIAAALTLAAFLMRSMAALRLAAIAANLCFILYGAMSWAYPVLVLHLVLLPCNVVRLYELRRSDSGGTVRVPEAAQCTGGASRRILRWVTSCQAR